MTKTKEHAMKLLLPVDGSEFSLEAVRFAIRLVADGLRADVVLANVQEPANLYELIVAHNPEVIEQVSADAGMHALRSAQALLEAAGIAYESEVAQGDPAHTIVDIVERFDCQMVIMGARGQSGLRRTLMGSVSNEVLHACPVPVLIAQPQKPPEVEPQE
jgi:nucleotide-binding universal stress UspA family protein